MTNRAAPADLASLVGPTGGRGLAQIENQLANSGVPSERRNFKLCARPGLHGRRLHLGGGGIWRPWAQIRAPSRVGAPTTSGQFGWASGKYGIYNSVCVAIHFRFSSARRAAAGAPGRLWGSRANPRDGAHSARGGLNKNKEVSARKDDMIIVIVLAVSAAAAAAVAAAGARPLWAGQVQWAGFLWARAPGWHNAIGRCVCLLAHSIWTAG